MTDEAEVKEHKSDPNKADTDGDGQNDKFEIENLTDPNDPESKSNVATITLIDGLLGGDLTDPEDDGTEGETIFANGDVGQTAGLNFNWVSITANAEEYFGNFGGTLVTLKAAIPLFFENYITACLLFRNICPLPGCCGYCSACRCNYFNYFTSMDYPWIIHG